MRLLGAAKLSVGGCRKPGAPGSVRVTDYAALRDRVELAGGECVNRLEHLESR